jgi:hypothetical protein
MRDETRGQASIELILVVGAIITMAIILIPVGLKNAEMNKGLSAARDGATFAAAMRGLGFAGEGVTSQPSGTIKILNITPEFVTTTGGLEEYRLRFYVSIPGSMDSTNTCSSINTQARRYIAYAFTGKWPSGAVVPLSDTTGSYYIFRVACTAT